MRPHRRLARNDGRRGFLLPVLDVEGGRDHHQGEDDTPRRGQLHSRDR